MGFPQDNWITDTRGLHCAPFSCIILIGQGSRYVRTLNGRPCKSHSNSFPQVFPQAWQNKHRHNMMIILKRIKRTLHQLSIAMVSKKVKHFHFQSMIPQNKKSSWLAVPVDKLNFFTTNSLQLVFCQPLAVYNIRVNTFESHDHDSSSTQGTQDHNSQTKGSSSQGSNTKGTKGDITQTP